jgi:hypothetical protein
LTSHFTPNALLARRALASKEKPPGVIVSQGVASREVFELTLHQAMEDIASPRYRCVFPVYLAYGQRIV